MELNNDFEIVYLCATNIIGNRVKILGIYVSTHILIIYVVNISKFV